MDIIVSYPNIIQYQILKQYVKNKINFDTYDFYVINNPSQLSYFEKIKSNSNILTTTKYKNQNQDNNENKDKDNDENQDEMPDEDVWETAINDEKFYINNKIARIFPVLKNFNNFSKIKIDDDSFCYITIREIADIITKIICYHLLEYNLNPQKTIIADYTSGVGGNVLSFCKFFKYIYAIELDNIRADYLKNNIGVYGYKNIQVINGCAIEFNNSQLIEKNPNVIFIDPPWGGSGYKNSSNLTLSLGSINLEDLVINIAEKFSNHMAKIVETNHKEKYNNYNNKFIILKLPKNYDVENFYNYVKTKNNFLNYNIGMCLYILNKMIIIVCELQFKYY